MTVLALLPGRFDGVHVLQLVTGIPMLIAGSIGTYALWVLRRRRGR